MRVVVVRQPDEDVLLVGQELEPATIKRHLCLAMTRCNMGIAVVAQLRYSQFVLNAHVATSLVTVTFPLITSVTTALALTISSS